ncbi:MAG: sensor histidine kinase [Pseudomonadota bacterium]
MLWLVQLAPLHPVHAQSAPDAVPPLAPHVVALAPGLKVGAVNDKVTGLVETNGRLTIEALLAPDIQAQFEPVTTIEPDFGYIPEGIWLRLDLVNTSPERLQRYLMLQTNFMTQIDVYVVGRAGPQSVLSQDESSTFSDRPVPYHELIAPFTLEPEERAQIFVRYRSNGNTVLPLAIEDEIGLATTTNAQLTRNFAFYGVMGMAILASIIARVFFPSPTFVAYFFYGAAVLLLLFQRDGYAFQFLWPNAPAWNDFASLPVGAALPLFAAIFTRTYLDTKNMHPSIDKILLGVCALQIGVVASSAVIGPAAAKQWALITVAIAIIIFISIGVLAFRHYGRRALFFLVGWTGLLAGTLVMSAVHWIGVDLTRAQSLDIMRGSLVFDGLMMGLASIFSVVNLQRDNARLTEERVAILDNNVRMHQRFARLQEKYEVARELAHSKGELVSDLTHDLRQPLFALRASISKLSDGEMSVKANAEVEESFEYIEALVEATLQHSIDVEESASPPSQSAAQTTSLARVFGSLQAMFAEDAMSSGNTLEIEPTGAVLATAPFPVLRIASNFVANAIGHAPGSRIMVSALEHEGSVQIIVADDGPGMEPTTLSQVKQRGVQENGEAPRGDGHGLGLAIVDKAAREAGFEWSIESNPGRGTKACLCVPKRAQRF